MLLKFSRVQHPVLEEALDHISECRKVCKQLTTPPDLSDPTPSLLFLYEFEAKLHLSHPQLGAVLERIMDQDTVDPKTLETIAGTYVCVCLSLCVHVCVYMCVCVCVCSPGYAGFS